MGFLSFGNLAFRRYDWRDALGLSLSKLDMVTIVLDAIAQRNHAFHTRELFGSSDEIVIIATKPIGNQPLQ